jgi:hypothetical protein
MKNSNVNSNVRILFYTETSPKINENHFTALYSKVGN